MAHLIINDRVKSLECQAQALLIRQENKPPLAIPLRRLDTLVLLHSVSLPSRLISTAYEMGIALVYINTHQLSRSFTIAPPGSAVYSCRLKQLQLTGNPASVGLIRFWLDIKFHRMLKTVESCIQRRPDARKVLFDCQRTIRQCQQQLTSQHTQDQLRGLEGKAQQQWFYAYRCLMPDSLGFKKRQRRPPPDPVNALLSLTYTRIYLLAWQAALCSGLDPALGFYHKAGKNRQALACDLMEPLRPLAEQFVLKLFSERIIRQRNFTPAGSGCLLKQEALMRFQDTFESEALVWKRLLWMYTQTIKNKLESAFYEQ
ncbi:CRISPR-associated endonuclease Cas1 [Endozoicomonas montiporae]|uniref:CRISPR-associated endonuclease Cas1 n=1 Tax=Endozoicomonas montiporae CL-33 TaxID=570277 RepID=A0A142BBT6_9GAMM|nr:CRISPR-associated endonuclease Cas1 [Endozoicomonas montiporae]AMO56212.1 CRISPR-associated protein Cas1 [Endozoicomonas montiporae CL-33]